MRIISSDKFVSVIRSRTLSRAIWVCEVSSILWRGFRFSHCTTISAIGLVFPVPRRAFNCQEILHTEALARMSFFSSSKSWSVGVTALTSSTVLAVFGSRIRFLSDGLTARS